MQVSGLRAAVAAAAKRFVQADEAAGPQLDEFCDVVERTLAGESFGIHELQQWYSTALTLPNAAVIIPLVAEALESLDASFPAALKQLAFAQVQVFVSFAPLAGGSDDILLLAKAGIDWRAVLSSPDRARTLFGLSDFAALPLLGFTQDLLARVLDTLGEQVRRDEPLTLDRQVLLAIANQVASRDRGVILEVLAAFGSAVAQGNNSDAVTRDYWERLLVSFGISWFGKIEGDWSLNSFSLTSFGMGRYAQAAGSVASVFHRTPELVELAQAHLRNGTLHQSSEQYFGKWEPVSPSLSWLAHLGLASFGPLEAYGLRELRAFLGRALAQNPKELFETYRSFANNTHSGGAEISTLAQFNENFFRLLVHRIGPERMAELMPLEELHARNSYVSRSLFSAMESLGVDHLETWQAIREAVQPLALEHASG